MCSSDVAISDYSLLEIGAGAILASKAQISCHTFAGDRLVVFPVSVGQNAFVGAGVTLGPRTTVGARSWIGHGSLLYNCNVPEDGKIEPHSQRQTDFNPSNPGGKDAHA